MMGVQRIGAPRWRAIVDNDFAGDPDGLVSLAHFALNESIETVLVTTSLLDPHLAELAGAPAAASAVRGRDIVEEMYTIVGRAAPPIVCGAESAGGTGDSAAALAIVEVLASPDERRAMILCGGPLTNIAAALRIDPTLQERARLVWVGGTLDGTAEYNRDTDAEAAEFVFASEMDIVQIPRERYALLRFSLAEISDQLGGSGALGRWLEQRLFDVPPFVTLHGALTLGDSSLVSVAGLDPEFSPMPEAGRREVADIDPRLLWGDLVSRLREHARRGQG